MQATDGKCNKDAANAKGLAYDIEKVTDTNAIIDAGIMRTPHFAIDGEILVEGKVASADEINSCSPEPQSAGTNPT